jgi:hypothetical protein
VEAMDSTESSKNRGAKTSAEKVKFDPFKPKLDIHIKEEVRMCSSSTSELKTEVG